MMIKNFLIATLASIACSAHAKPHTASLLKNLSPQEIKSRVKKVAREMRIKREEYEALTEQLGATKTVAEQHDIEEKMSDVNDYFVQTKEELVHLNALLSAAQKKATRWSWSRMTSTIAGVGAALYGAWSCLGTLATPTAKTTLQNAESKQPQEAAVSLQRAPIPSLPIIIPEQPQRVVVNAITHTPELPESLFFSDDLLLRGTETRSITSRQPPALEAPATQTIATQPAAINAVQKHREERGVLQNIVDGAIRIVQTPLHLLPRLLPSPKHEQQPITLSKPETNDVAATTKPEVNEPPKAEERIAINPARTSTHAWQGEEKTAAQTKPIPRQEQAGANLLAILDRHKRESVNRRKEKEALLCRMHSPASCL